MRLVFDIETDGLDATLIWCLVIQDIDTKKSYSFTDHDDKYMSVSDGLNMLKNASCLIGHNIIGYDIPMIQKVTGIDLWDKKIHDTWIMSQTLNYNRGHKHGLGSWGEHLGYAKFEFDDWTTYTEGMMKYCVRDVSLNARVYDILLKEL